MRALAATALLALLSAPNPGRAQDRAAGERYQQSEAVLSRFPALAVKLDTPAFQTGATAVTSQADLEAFLLGLAKPGAPVSLQILAATPQGRNIPILYLSKERLTSPEDLRRTGRPIVWLIGQQHGNEPAGSEGLLAIARSLIEGELRPLLNDLVVVIVPRANPDGAAADLRDAAGRLDMNRDHATFQLPEVRALHQAVRALPPDVVIDAHEFAPAGRWLARFGGLHGSDLMVLGPTHPAVSAAVRELADGVFLPAIEAAARGHGLKTVPYHNFAFSGRADDKTVSIGLHAPGIARNAFGLGGAVSLLLESRGLGTGIDTYQRRVATHVVAVQAVLETAAKDAGAIKRRLDAERRDVAASRAELRISATPATTMLDLPLVEPVSGASGSHTLAAIDQRQAQGVVRRTRPAGYLISGEPRAGIIAQLQLLGAPVCLVRTAAAIDAEVYEVERRQVVDRRIGDPDVALKATVRARRMTAAAGGLYVPMNSSAALRIAAVLEADAPGSWMAMDVLRPSALTPFGPVVRVMQEGGLDVIPTDGTPVGACPMPR